MAILHLFYKFVKIFLPDCVLILINVGADRKPEVPDFASYLGLFLRGGVTCCFRTTIQVPLSPIIS